MSGDYVERLRSFLDAHRPDSARHVTADVLATLPNPDGRGWRHLTGEDLRAALDELERLRLFEGAICEAQVSLQSSAFYVGWLKGFKATATAGVYTQAHLDTVEYAEEIRALTAGSVPQQPESGGDPR